MTKKEQHIPYKASVLELFGGIGAPRMALNNLFGDCKIRTIDYVDVLNWAAEAYSAMSTTCYLPQSVIDWNIKTDIVIHGSPCQDFSIAGNGKGGEKDSGTRSSLLWQTIDIIKNRLVELPSVVIWENVKGVLSKTHRHIFDAYLKEMSDLGYVNTWKVLNGIDYGVPQRRERIFVVSILHSDTRYNHFDFEKLIKNDMEPLKNFLEKDVDVSYYIKQKSMVKAIEQGKIFIVDNVVRTITTKQMRWNNAGVIKIPLTTFNQENYVFNPESSTLPTITAGGANSRLKIAIPKFSNELPVFVIDDKPYHLRVITPREAWRLMGFRDEHYDKIDNLLPKTAKYHLAGNSIIVQVMEAIFKELLWKQEKVVPNA